MIKVSIIVPVFQGDEFVIPFFLTLNLISYHLILN